MRIITLNINGIRSGAKKEFFTWMNEVDADVICLQETKAQITDLIDPIFFPKGYHAFFCDAQKKGYSGVAIYCKQKPVKVHTEIGFDIIDNEGRYVQVDFENFSVTSLYLPSGTSGEGRQEVKYQVLDFYLEHLKNIATSKKTHIICGDINIAHKNIDIKNWKSNQKTSGFLPEERAWLDKVFDDVGLVDAFRVINQEPEQYTWWSNRGQAYAKNVGWRIDYHIVTPDLKDKIQQVSVYKDRKFSDHAPVVMDYAF